MSKKLRKIKPISTDGDIHFIYEKSCSCKWIVENRYCDEFEARRVSKVEALKPLLLLRE